MSTNEPLSCRMVIGNLIPRPCGEKAAGTCKKCKKPYCADHGSSKQCRDCTSGKPGPVAVLDVPYDMAFDPLDFQKFQVERNDDPSDAWADLT